MHLGHYLIKIIILYEQCKLWIQAWQFTKPHCKKLDSVWLLTFMFLLKTNLKICQLMRTHVCILIPLKMIIIYWHCTHGEARSLWPTLWSSEGSCTAAPHTPLSWRDGSDAHEMTCRHHLHQNQIHVPEKQITNNGLFNLYFVLILDF